MTPSVRSLALGGLAAALIVGAVTAPSSAVATRSAHSVHLAHVVHVAQVERAASTRLAPAVVPALTLSATLLRPGLTLTVSGQGCTGTHLRGVHVLLLRGLTTVTEVDLGPADVTAGNWTASLTVPAAVASGADTVSATCDLYSSTITYASVPVTVDASTPVARMILPTLGVQVTRTFLVRFTATDTVSGVRDYDIQLRNVYYTGRAVPWHFLIQHTTQTFGGLDSLPGWQHCIRVRARDKAGNVSAWTPQRCTSIPLDERSLTRSAGWAKRTASAAFEHTLLTSSTKGATLSLRSVRGTRIALLVRTCPTCGAVTVTSGRTVIATLSTKSAAVRNRVVLLTGRFAVNGTVVVRTTSKKPVTVDGIAVLHA